MARKIPGEESNRFYCSYCGFPCKVGWNEEGDYGIGGWDFFDGDISGSNLVPNSIFTDTTGWTGSSATLAAVAGGQAGNCLQITRTARDSQYAYCSLSNLEPEGLYRTRAYVKSGTSGNEAYIVRIMDSSREYTMYSQAGTSSSTWTLSTALYWRPVETSATLCLIKNSSTTGTMLFDTVDTYLFYYKAKEALSGCSFCGSKNWRH